MTNQAPIMIVQRLEKGGWEVLITPAGYVEPIRVTGFKSDKAAQAWVDGEALTWLAAHKIAA